MANSTTITPVEATAIGAASGAIEVCINQPTVTWKNATQQGRPLPKTPVALYRGLLINVASVAPITATQFGANRAYEKALTQLKGSELNQGQRVVAALGAGATSALISCPSELIMIQQQAKGISLSHAFKDFLAEHGLGKIYRGISSAVVRDGLYTAGYLGVTPVLIDYFQRERTFEGFPGQVPMMVAGVTGGLLASVGTHWADTIKTRMQSNLDANKTPQYRNSFTTCATIVADSGVRGLWAGNLPRMIRIVGATFILNWTRNGMTSLLEERKAQLLTPAS